MAEQCHYSYFRASQSLSPEHVGVCMIIMEGCLRYMYFLRKLTVLCYLFSKPQNHFLSIYDPNKCLLWLYQKLVNAGLLYSQWFLMSYVSLSWILLFQQIEFWNILYSVFRDLWFLVLWSTSFSLLYECLFGCLYSSGWKNSYSHQKIVSISLSISFYYWFLLRMNQVSVWVSFLCGQSLLIYFHRL